MTIKRIILLATFLTFTLCLAEAQTLLVLHAFSGVDGSQPFGLITDAAGNFYGVTESGGGTQSCCGTVYELSPVGAGYKFTLLHHFMGGLDGAQPVGNLVLDEHGNLFGVTESGGVASKPCKSTCGTVYELSPNSGAGWTYSQIYQFQGVSVGDGMSPDAALVVDAAGNLYGTTEFGGLLTRPAVCGSTGCGTVFELSPGTSGWADKVLYKFSGNPDGAYPRSPLLFDTSGNLFGATSQGGGQSCSLGSGKDGCGAIFNLVPSARGWTEKVLYGFIQDDGEIPYQALIFDSNGTLYGTTNLGGDHGFGTVYAVIYEANGDDWVHLTLHDINGASDGAWPAGGVTLAANGNLYGTTVAAGSHDAGTVFFVGPASGGGYALTVVMAFSGGVGGSGPEGNLLLDSANNIYGTAGFGGPKGDGLVFKIIP